VNESLWQQRHNGDVDGKSPVYPREGTPAPKVLTTPLEFHPPKDFAPPAADDQQDGKWEMTCTFETLPNGKLRLVRLGDSEMPLPKEKDKEKPKRPTYDALAARIARPPGGAQGAMQPGDDEAVTN
jgi:hypothetical protein